MHPNRLPMYVCMHVCTYVCMCVSTYACICLCVQYVCMCVCRNQMSYIVNMVTIFVQACMYKQKQSKTQFGEIHCHTAGENRPSWWVMQIDTNSLWTCGNKFGHQCAWKHHSLRIFYYRVGRTRFGITCFMDAHGMFMWICFSSFFFATVLMPKKPTHAL